jgi:hypothetical protein
MKGKKERKDEREEGMDGNERMAFLGFHDCTHSPHTWIKLFLCRHCGFCFLKDNDARSG